MVLVNVHRVSRSCELFLDGCDLHLLHHVGPGKREEKGERERARENERERDDCTEAAPTKKTRDPRKRGMSLC